MVYVSVAGEPGITSESLAALEMKANEKAAKGEPLLGGLIMDEMAIRQHVEWNHHTKHLEGVAQPHQQDGNEMPDHSVPAKGAMVFMVSGIQDSWKIPVAYFFIAGMNAEEQKTTIETILISLHEAGVTIVSLTFDGTSTNLSTANALGCNLKPSSCKPLKTCFKHPCADYEVFVIFDPVHMQKLVRNTLHAQGTLLTRNGVVKWSYIEKLNELQNRSGNRLASKLTDKHINFQNSKMKVSLAVQVISQSVASALGILRASDDSFADTEATEEFLSLFNDMFDLFNSMSSDAQGFKRPLSKLNFDLYHNAFEYLEEFLRNIKLRDGTPILESRNKTGFLGFLVNIYSFREIYRIYPGIYVEENGILDELFTYLFSQDHIETFFGTIRTKGGCNNNPSTTQFKAIYKRLLTNNNITCSAKANCSQFAETKNLFACYITMPTKCPKISTKLPNNPLPTETVLSKLPTESSTDDFFSAALARYALDVHKRLMSTVGCKECIEALVEDNTLLITAVCKIADGEFKVGYIFPQTNRQSNPFFFG